MTTLEENLTTTAEPVDCLTLNTVTPVNGSKSMARLVTVDALRGLAALMVLLYHARVMLWQGNSLTYRQFGLRPSLSSWMGYSTTIFAPGFLGVTLFFVLSGYCVHRRGAHRLAQDSNARLALGEYALKRLWRIYPVYVAALLLTALVDAYLAHRVIVLDPGQDDSLGAFLVSLAALQGYVAQFFGSNGVFWTLAMELHFYALYPFLFALSRRYGPRAPLLLAGALSIAYVLMNFHFHLTEMFPHRGSRGPVLLPYWFTWTLGFYLAEVEAGRARLNPRLRLKALGITSAALGALLTSRAQHEAADLFWALTFTTLVWGSLRSATAPIWTGPPARILARIGGFSYSLYAIHAPVLLVTATVLIGRESKPLSVVPLILAVMWTLAVAWAFFQVVERWTLTPFWRSPADRAASHAAP